MFVCARCRHSTPLPTCERCGFAFEMVDGMYQLTADANANLSEDGVRYIGCDAVGELLPWQGLDRVTHPPATGDIPPGAPC